MLNLVSIYLVVLYDDNWFLGFVLLRHRPLHFNDKKLLHEFSSSEDFLIHNKAPLELAIAIIEFASG